MCTSKTKISFLQQEISKNKNVVMDGRDIGTKVLAEAEIKFYNYFILKLEPLEDGRN